MENPLVVAAVGLEVKLAIANPKADLEASPVVESDRPMASAMAIAEPNLEEVLDPNLAGGLEAALKVTTGAILPRLVVAAAEVVSEAAVEEDLGVAVEVDSESHLVVDLAVVRYSIFVNHYFHVIF